MDANNAMATWTPEGKISPAGTSSRVHPSPPPLRRVEDGGRSRVCSLESRHHRCSSIPDLSKAVDLSHLPDNEFFLISPDALPQPPSAFFTSEDPSSSDDEAMEVEAITSTLSSSRNAVFRSLAQGNRSRSVTVGSTEDARAMSPSCVASRFRVPAGLALQPRGKSAQTPWQSVHNASTW